jgi:hypothetical protein
MVIVKTPTSPKFFTSAIGTGISTDERLDCPPFENRDGKTSFSKEEIGVELFGRHLRLGVFVLKCQGADRADLDAFGAFAAGGFAKRFVLEGGDDSLKTPSGKANGSDAKFFLADPHTFTAKDTFVRIVGKERTAFVDGEVSFELSESFCDELDAEMFGNLLKFTGSVFLTVTAIHRMTCQDQFSGGACKP